LCAVPSSDRHLDHDFHLSAGSVIDLPGCREEDNLDGTVPHREGSIDWRAAVVRKWW